MLLTKNWKFYISLLWLLVTLSFAGWWLVNGLNLLKLSTELSADQISRYKFMLVSEGITWMILLVLGGGTLIYFIFKEGKKNEETKKFVASFSHDLKTSIASLRLQAESLKEDIKDPEVEVLIYRLVNDSIRLQVQLENSLQFSSENKMKMHLEKIPVQLLVESLSYQWPDLVFNYKDANNFIYADKRAIDIILRNIIYNAKVHGQARVVDVNFNEAKRTLSISNNGKVFEGNVAKLGELYYRHNPSSGSGLGLYIVSSLMKEIQGQVQFLNNPFQVQLMFSEDKI